MGPASKLVSLVVSFYTWENICSVCGAHKTMINFQPCSSEAESVYYLDNDTCSVEISLKLVI